MAGTAPSTIRPDSLRVVLASRPKGEPATGNFRLEPFALPSVGRVPFLSILGTGEAPEFQFDGKTRHESIRSTQKRFVALDASTNADGHGQAANRMRLAQEICGWMDTIFAQDVGGPR